MDKLSSCAHCQKSKLLEMYHEKFGHIVRCTFCGAMVSSHISMEEARKVWNARAQPKPEALTVEQLAAAYLELCDHDCAGDSSVGLAPCIFWEWPDVDENDNPVANGCKLLVYDRKSEGA